MMQKIVNKGFKLWCEGIDSRKLSHSRIINVLSDDEEEDTKHKEQLPQNYLNYMQGTVRRIINYFISTELFELYAGYRQKNHKLCHFSFQIFDC